MSKEQIETGLFLRLPDKTISDLYIVLVSEGYEATPHGVALFLSDVSQGKLSNHADESETSDILGLVGSLGRKHGPELVRAALAAIKTRR